MHMMNEDWSQSMLIPQQMATVVGVLQKVAEGKIRMAKAPRMIHAGRVPCDTCELTYIEDSKSPATC